MHAVRSLFFVSAFASSVAAQGGIWAPLSFPASPTARWAATMVYDSARDRMVLIGGMPNVFGGVQETWESTGTQWVFRGAVGPYGSLGQVAAAYDSSRQVAVAVQASGGGNLETWEWNGTAWTLRTTPVAPGPRSGFAVAFDSVRGVTVLFGGRNGSTHYADTWEWNGTVWQQRSSGGPLPRISHAMAFDAARARTVVFGGHNDANPAQYGDTWEWNGSYWQEAFGVIGPQPRSEHAMTYDGLRHRIVVLGGRAYYGGGQEYQDTWEWNGTAWTNMQTSAPVPGAPAVAFDSLRQRTVSFGGRFFSSNIQDGTYAYGFSPVVASVVPYGAGCAGPTGVPTLVVQSGAARLGALLTLRIGNLPTGILNVPIGWLGFDNTVWSGIPLPLALDPLGFPGCTALLAPSASYALSNTGGLADWPIAIPFLPAFAGLQFYVQGGVLVIGFNPGGVVFTRGLAGVVGR